MKNHSHVFEHIFQHVIKQKHNLFTLFYKFLSHSVFAHIYSWVVLLGHFIERLLIHPLTIIKHYHQYQWLLLTGLQQQLKTHLINNVFWIKIKYLHFKCTSLKRAVIFLSHEEFVNISAVKRGKLRVQMTRRWHLCKLYPPTPKLHWGCFIKAVMFTSSQQNSKHMQTRQTYLVQLLIILSILLSPGTSSFKLSWFQSPAQNRCLLSWFSMHSNLIWSASPASHLHPAPPDVCSLLYLGRICCLAPYYHFSTW